MIDHVIRNSFRYVINPKEETYSSQSKRITYQSFGLDKNKAIASITFFISAPPWVYYSIKAAKAQYLLPITSYFPKIPQGVLVEVRVKRQEVRGKK